LDLVHDRLQLRQLTRQHAASLVRIGDVIPDIAFARVELQPQSAELLDPLLDLLLGVRVSRDARWDGAGGQAGYQQERARQCHSSNHKWTPAD
jgi:hypothetical protein